MAHHFVWHQLQVPESDHFRVIVVGSVFGQQIDVEGHFHLLGLIILQILLVAVNYLLDGVQFLLIGNFFPNGFPQGFILVLDILDLLDRHLADLGSKLLADLLSLLHERILDSLGADLEE